jgi:L-lactate dehydrogenase complex protein LldG
MADARSEILERIRQANGGAAPDRASSYQAITRKYRRSRVSEPEQVIECFIDRLVDYGSDVHHCAENDIAQKVREVVTGRNKKGLLVSPNVPAAWLPADFLFVEDSGLSHEDLDDSEGVLTGCAVAIALTGTIVLDHGRERRALTLIPDYHLCVVFKDQVVETVPEALDRMQSFNTNAITTISGSSATADIEMMRIKGVHGPRVLDVILVD